MESFGELNFRIVSRSKELPVPEVMVSIDNKDVELVDGLSENQLKRLAFRLKLKPNEVYNYIEEQEKNLLKDYLNYINYKRMPSNKWLIQQQQKKYSQNGNDNYLMSNEQV